MKEVNKALDHIQQIAAGKDNNGDRVPVNIIWGTSIKPELEDKIEIIIVVTGFHADSYYHEAFGGKLDLSLETKEVAPTPEPVQPTPPITIVVEPQKPAAPTQPVQPVTPPTPVQKITQPTPVAEPVVKPAMPVTQPPKPAQPAEPKQVQPKPVEPAPVPVQPVQPTVKPAEPKPVQPAQPVQPTVKPAEPKPVQPAQPQQPQQPYQPQQGPQQQGPSRNVAGGGSEQSGNVTAPRPVAQPRPTTPKPEEPEITIDTVGSVKPEVTTDDEIIVDSTGKKKGIISGWFDKLSVIFTGNDNDEYTF
jgi:hypothetical protein